MAEERERCGYARVALDIPPAALIEAGLVAYAGRTKHGPTFALTAEGSWLAAGGEPSAHVANVCQIKANEQTAKRLTRRILAFVGKHNGACSVTEVAQAVIDPDDLALPCETPRQFLEQALDLLILLAIQGAIVCTRTRVTGPDGRFWDKALISLPE